MKTRYDIAVVIIILLGLLLSYTSISAQENQLVTSFEALMVKQPPPALKLDVFYQKYADAYGIPVVASRKVPDVALLVGRDIINYMLLKRPDVREQMIKMNARLSIMAVTEMQTDLPEYRNWKKPTLDDVRLTPSERANYNQPGGIGSMTDRGYWNQRARGMGGIQTSCAEENIMGYPGTKYYGENILVHEWSHNIMTALSKCDTALYREIHSAYQSAKEKGMYKGQYAINTVAEYWAEGSQWWFWSNYEFNDGQTRVQSPEDLKAYDPTLFSILAKVYIGHHIPADVYYGKNIPFSAQKVKR